MNAKLCYVFSEPINPLLFGPNLNLYAFCPHRWVKKTKTWLALFVVDSSCPSAWLFYRSTWPVVAFSYRSFSLCLTFYKYNMTVYWVNLLLFPNRLTGKYSIPRIFYHKFSGTMKYFNIDKYYNNNFSAYGNT